MQTIITCGLQKKPFHFIIHHIYFLPFSFLAWTIFSLSKHMQLWQATMTSVKHLFFYPILSGTWGYWQNACVGMARTKVRFESWACRAFCHRPLVVSYSGYQVRYSKEVSTTVILACICVRKVLSEKLAQRKQKLLYAQLI